MLHAENVTIKWEPLAQRHDTYLGERQQLLPRCQRHSFKEFCQVQEKHSGSKHVFVEMSTKDYGAG